MKKRNNNRKDEAKEAIAQPITEEAAQEEAVEAAQEPMQEDSEPMKEGAGENTKKAEEKRFGTVDYDYTTRQNDPDLAVKPVAQSGDGPQTVKCPNCGEEMPATISTCVNCGHYLKENEKRYKPIEESKIKKIRWIITVVCIVAFIIYMVVKNI